MRIALPARLSRISWRRLDFPFGTEWAIAAFTGTLIAALAGLRLQADGIAVVWPVAGFITGLLVLARDRQRAAVVAGAALALCLGNFHAGRGLATALVFIAGNLLEGLAIALVLDKIADRRFNLSSLFRGLQLAVVSAMASGATAWGVAEGLRASGYAHAAFRDVWWLWFSSHLGGILLIAPLIITLGSAEPSSTKSSAHPLRGPFVDTARLSIRKRLLLSVAALAIPLNLVIVATLAHLATREREADGRQLAYTAQSISAALDAHLATYETFARALAASPRLLAPDLKAFEAEARPLFLNLKDTWLLVADADGRQLLNLAAKPGQPMPRRSWIGIASQRRAFESGHPVISDLYRGSVTGDWLLTIDVPLFKEGHPFRLVGVVMSARGLLQFLNDRRMPHGWEASITDRFGRFVARAPGNAAAVGQLAPAEWARLRHATQPFTMMSLEGERIFGTATTSSSSGWSISVAIRERVLVSSMTSTVRWATLLGGAISFFSLMLALTIARSISQPLLALQGNAQRLIAGQRVDMSSRLPEAHSLGRALESAMEERHRAREQLKESEARLRLALEASDMGTWNYQCDARTGSCDERGRRVFGLPLDRGIDAHAWEAIIHPEDAAAQKAAFAAALDPNGRRRYEAVYRVRRPSDGREAWISSVAIAEFDGNRCKQLIGTVADITDRKRNEEQLQMVMREVTHRSKNILALVQAVARQISADNPAHFMAQFSERLQALAASQDLLISGASDGVDLGDLIRSQLGHFSDLIGHRITIEGPALSISADAARTLGMAMHELATNASKYGALASDEGRVSIRWTAAGGPEGRVELLWSESGGAPVTRPRATGFGTVVFDRMVRAGLSADVSMDYAEQGFAWRMSCAVRNVRAAGADGR